MRSTGEGLVPAESGGHHDPPSAVFAPAPVWQRFARLFSFEPADEIATASDAEVLTRLRDAEALLTQVTSEQARWLRELRRRRLAAQVTAHRHEGEACDAGCCDPDGWVACEVAVALGMTERQVDARISTARQLKAHPAVQGLMDDGAVQVWTATVLLQHLATLAQYVTERQLAQVEDATLAWLRAGTRTVTQLNARMRRLIQRARAAARRDGQSYGRFCPTPTPWPSRQPCTPSVTTRRPQTTTAPPTSGAPTCSSRSSPATRRCSAGPRTCPARCATPSVCRFNSTSPSRRTASRAGPRWGGSGGTAMSLQQRPGTSCPGTGTRPPRARIGARHGRWSTTRTPATCWGSPPPP